MPETLIKKPASGTAGHREGDLYKVLTAHGKTFPIYYGYYEEIDREHDPLEIYPDFLKTPAYTASGMPFVTAMQRPCSFFFGEPDEDNTCYQCAHYERCVELLGVCRCEARRPQKTACEKTINNITKRKERMLQ